MERMVLCGWDEGAAGLIRALAERAQLEPVAVGDQHAGHLVRARAATRLACFQHLRQMVADLDFEAVLLAAPELTEELATVAAIRGADLLLVGDQMDGASLQAAATAATRHGAALAVLRPALRNAGLAFFTDLIDAEPRWAPAVLDLELRDERPAVALLRDAIAATVRLVDRAPREVVLSTAGLDPQEPSTIAAQLRYTEGSLVTLSARGFSEPRLRLSAQTGAGMFEVDAARGDSRIAISPWGAEPERSVLRDGDTLDLEARRVARIRAGEALDARFAPREAAVLRAAEESLASGGPAPVEDSSVRATFRLLAGGAEPGSPRRGRLHLVTGR